MTDVRLTATNPDDSSVVPVACNSKGELLLEDVPVFDGNVDGDLTVSGSAKLAGDIDVNGGINGAGASIFSDGRIYGRTIYAQGSVGNGILFQGLKADGTEVFKVAIEGSATFAGDVVIGSRNKKWMIVESNGLAHLVEQTRSLSDDAKYPELRNIPQELDLIEKALGDVMEKLRMNPPAGWTVWDGSSENS